VQVQEMGMGHPVLVGDRGRIQRAAQERALDIEGMEIVDPREDGRRHELARRLYDLRWRHGLNRREAEHKVRHPRRYALLLLDQEHVDCAVIGTGNSYPSAVRDALGIVGTRKGKAAALHVMALKDRVLFLGDTSINIEPSSRMIADVAIAAADMALELEYEPRIAVLSFSNFGSVAHPSAERAARAVDLVREERPDLVVDGEMHADMALSPDIARRLFPDSVIQGDANVLVFPDLASGNIGYKLLEHLAGADAIGPILLGMTRPVVVSYQAASAQTLVNLTAIALVHAERRRERDRQRDLFAGPR
jgi:malate dehydrogenase (oxaloacetate-decarboxylating)(NADP+)